MEKVCPTCGHKITDVTKQPRCPRCNTLVKEIPRCENCKSHCIKEKKNYTKNSVKK